MASAVAAAADRARLRGGRARPPRRGARGQAHYDGCSARGGGGAGIWGVRRCALADKDQVGASGAAAATVPPPQQLRHYSGSVCCGGARHCHQGRRVGAFDVAAPAPPAAALALDKLVPVLVDMSASLHWRANLLGQLVRLCTRRAPLDASLKVGTAAQLRAAPRGRRLSWRVQEHPHRRHGCRQRSRVSGRPSRCGGGCGQRRARPSPVTAGTRGGVVAAEAARTHGGTVGGSTGGWGGLVKRGTHSPAPSPSSFASLCGSQGDSLLEVAALLAAVADSSVAAGSPDGRRPPLWPLSLRGRDGRWPRRPWRAVQRSAR